MRNKIVLLLLAVTIFNVTLPARTKVRVACIGDSITYGAGIKDRDNDSYPAVLQGLLGPAYEVRNFGFNARVMSLKGDHPYMEEKMYGEVKAFLPDIVMIMLGTNDIKPRNWDPEQYETSYKTMISELKALDSHPDIFLCYPPTIATDRWEVTDKCIVEGVMPIIDRLAARSWLDIIDTHSATAGMPQNYCEDGIHPNEGGAAVLARTVADALRRNGCSAVPGKRVLFIGDSISDGEWGGGRGRSSQERNHYDMNHFLGHGFPEMCAARCMADRPGSNLRFYNRGISGGTMQKMVQRWDTDVLAVHPDIVSILIGINDVGGDTVETYDFASWEGSYRSVLDKTLAADPDVKFVLCSPFVTEKNMYGPTPDFLRRHAIVARMAEIVKKLAAEYGCTYVDTFGLVERLAAEDKASDHLYWMWDGIHPATACHQKIADLWLKGAKKVVFRK